MKGSSLSIFFLKYEKLLFLTIIVLLFVMTWSFTIPRVKVVLEGQEALKREKEKIARLEAKIADLESLNDYELSERANLTLKAVSEEKNVFGVLLTLRDQANENQLVIKKISVNPGEVSEATASATKNSGEIEFKLEVEGSVENIKEFFNKIQKFLPLMSASNLKMNFSEGNAAIDFVLKGYYLALPKTLGKIDDPLPKLTSEEEKILSEISGYNSLNLQTFTPVASERKNPFSF
jgi:hypothetical protein